MYTQIQAEYEKYNKLIEEIKESYGTLTTTNALTEDGQKQIGELYQQFEQQTSGNQMFRKGGKIDQLVTKYQYGGNFYKRWSSGDIAKLQTFLAGHGYDPGVINGKMGQSTINAIIIRTIKKCFKK